jgi:hypothetical protein
MHVRFTPKADNQADVSLSPLCATSGREQMRRIASLHLVGGDRLHHNHGVIRIIKVACWCMILNQCCSETLLKIVFQQYLPLADISAFQSGEGTTLVPPLRVVYPSAIAAKFGVPLDLGRRKYLNGGEVILEMCLP